MAASACETIEALERNWCEALCSKDYRGLGDLVHPDFTLIGTRASGPFVMGRQEWIDAIQRRDVVAIDIEVKNATALDQVMVGTVHARWRLKYLGRVIEDCVILTDVWVKEGDRWLALRRHSTPAPASECRPAAKGNR